MYTNFLYQEDDEELEDGFFTPQEQWNLLSQVLVKAADEKSKGGRGEKSMLSKCFLLSF